MKAALLGLILCAGAAAGCTKQQGAVVAPAIPAVSSCVARIISDALSGMSRADILADVPTSCASSIVEIDNVIAGYAPSLPAVKRAPAYLEVHGAP